MAGKNPSTSVHLALKARVVEDLEVMEERIFNFTQTIGHIAYQHDTYFQVNSGQIKLRLTGNSKDCGQLITSKSVPGSPDLIESQSTEISDIKKMKKTLGLCLPKIGTIKKRRRVYVNSNGNVRINLDDIEMLGRFVDIEIQGTAEEERSKEAESVKRELGITDAQIIPSTYLELYRKLKTADSGVDDMSSDASAE